MTQSHTKIAFQGSSGAYSDLACREVYPGMEALSCASFDEAFNAVRDGRAGKAMIPVDNTIAGRVADVHHLLPASGLSIVGEHFQAIRHNLLAVTGTKLQDLRHIHSHIHALPQCRELINEMALEKHVHADTAGAAQFVAEKKDPAHAAISSDLAAEIYGLEILKANIQDQDTNTTRFLILSQDPDVPPYEADTAVISSLLFTVRNIPAALYKALGGFATNGLSLTKLESYVDNNFEAARFYCDIEGHPDSEAFKLAIEELGFYADDVIFLGAYPAHPFRYRKK